MTLLGTSNDVELRVEHIRNLIAYGSDRDIELAAGLATSETLSSVQTKIVQATSLCDDLAFCVREVIRNRER